MNDFNNDEAETVILTLSMPYILKYNRDAITLYSCVNNKNYE